MEYNRPIVCGFVKLLHPTCLERSIEGDEACFGERVPLLVREVFQIKNPR